MKKKLKTATIAVGLVSLLGAGCVPFKNVSPKKVEAIEQHLKDESVLHLGQVLIPADADIEDGFRVGALFYNEDQNELGEAMQLGISKPGLVALLYPLIGDSDVEIIDYKHNGYGNIDVLAIDKDGELEEITDLSVFKKIHAGAIYKIVVDEYFRFMTESGEESKAKLEDLELHLNILKK